MAFFQHDIELDRKAVLGQFHLTSPWPKVSARALPIYFLTSDLGIALFQDQSIIPGVGPYFIGRDRLGDYRCFCLTGEHGHASTSQLDPLG
jgi:hypothetical protein